MFLEAIRDALIFTAFLFGMPLALGIAFDLTGFTIRRMRGGKNRGHRH